MALIESGHEVVVLDNLANSSEEVFARIGRITGTEPLFIRADVRDRDRLDEVFSQHAIDAVML